MFRAENSLYTRSIRNLTSLFSKYWRLPFANLIASHVRLEKKGFTHPLPSSYKDSRYAGRKPMISLLADRICENEQLCVLYIYTCTPETKKQQNNNKTFDRSVVPALLMPHRCQQIPKTDAAFTRRLRKQP